MSDWYTITTIESGPREWSGQGGTFHAFRVTLRNESGAELGNVEINKKPGNEPRLGSENYGDVDTSGEYGPKFKYAKTTDGSPAVRGGSPSQSGSGSSSGSSGDGYYRPYAPEDIAAMRRQKALDFAAAVTGPIPEGVDPELHRSTLAGWARWYEEQIGQAAEEAAPAEAETGDPGPEPEQSEAFPEGSEPGDPGSF